jgi:hypothetical protein
MGDRDIAGLRFHFRKIEAAQGDARRCAGLEAAEGESELRKAFGKAGSAGEAGGTLLAAEFAAGTASCKSLDFY